MRVRSFEDQIKFNLGGVNRAAGKEIVCALGTGTPYSWLGTDIGLEAGSLVNSVTDAYARLTSGRGDTIHLTPEAHTLAASLTWAYSNSKLLGQSPAGMFAHRSRIGMSTTFSPMITVSGSNNLFQNIYTQHGTAATDYIGWTISGHRNVFDHVHFAGPMNAAQGGHASYIGVNVTGSENYFKHCVFGSKSIGRDEVTPNLKIAGGDNIFEDCLFVLQLTDTDPIFVLVDNSTTVNAWFKGCQFFAFSPNQAAAMAVAFAFSAGASADITLDAGCAFHNVTKLAASASMHYLWTPTVFAATTDELNLISINSATY